MASVFLLDANTGDRIRENGAFVRTSDPVTIALQLARQRLRLIAGEVLTNQLAGIPYLSQLTGKGVQLGDVEGAFRAELLEVPGIVAITKLDVTAGPDRSVSVEFEATLDVAELANTTQISDSLVLPQTA